MTKRKKSRRKKTGLAGIQEAMITSSSIQQKQLLIGVLAALGGNIVGAGLGNFSFWGGALVSGVGIMTRNLYVTAAGAGMLVNTIQKAPGAINGADDEMDGISIEGAKTRVSHLFDSLKNKMMLQPPSEGVSGLGENQVRYFTNPYETNRSSLDLSELNRIQEQVARMDGLAEIDPTERNF